LLYQVLDLLEIEVIS